ncbi:MAG: ferredoxin [Patescibacteria group bacterium]
MNAALENLKNALKKPHVNSTCIGCGACAAIAGDVFDLDEMGLSCVKSLPEYPESDTDDAISACPVSAISWQPADENGEYLNGVAEHQDV